MELSPFSQATPLMQQYFIFKKQYPDAFVFFQVGDFYELFFDDAIKASKLLSLTLTTRGKHMEESIPLCGIPVSTIENYSVRLAQMGHMIVLCKQNEKAVPGKIVSRIVDEIITPGSIVSERGLSEDKISYLCFVEDHLEKGLDFLFFDFLTLNMVTYQLSKEKIYSFYSLIDQYRAKEIIYLNELSLHIKNEILKRPLFIHNYQFDSNSFLLVDKFKSYVRSIYPLIDVNKITVQDGKLIKSLQIDYKTQQHLDLLENSFTKEKKGSLYGLLDKTDTSFGKRLLKQWIQYPLIDLEKITKRQHVIEYLLTYWNNTELLKNFLKKLFDVERIVGRIELNKASYVDYQRLIFSLEVLLEMISYESYFLNSPLDIYFKEFMSIDDLYIYLNKRIFIEKNEDDFYIRPESDSVLKELEMYVFDAHTTILNFEKEKQIELEIPDLKIKEVPVHGYVLEISKEYSKKIPFSYVRVQTLASRERFVFEDLKKLEEKILGAKEAYEKRDRELYQELKTYVFDEAFKIKKNISLLAELDVLISLALVARTYNYKRPVCVEKGLDLIIEEALHPVLLELNIDLVSNSLLCSTNKKTLIITGPNMGGKSTFMRQNALIVLMAHMGSFIPAKKAQIPLMDGIYTRLSSFDNIFYGKSTFYLEMEDVKDILEKATSNSLVLLDEIGRGTSTYDGMRLAYAIIKYLNQEIRPYTLCATHYHELYDFFKDEESIKWIQSSIIKNKDKFIFLFKMIDGNSNDSLGIEIAKQAGIYENILKIAESLKI
jgi:DNA mismatch repair protein MutS